MSWYAKSILFLCRSSYLCAWKSLRACSCVYGNFGNYIMVQFSGSTYGHQPTTDVNYRCQQQIHVHWRDPLEQNEWRRLNPYLTSKIWCPREFQTTAFIYFQIRHALWRLPFMFLGVIPERELLWWCVYGNLGNHIMVQFRDWYLLIPSASLTFPVFDVYVFICLVY